MKIGLLGDYYFLIDVLDDKGACETFPGKKRVTSEEIRARTGQQSMDNTYGVLRSTQPPTLRGTGNE